MAGSAENTLTERIVDRIKKEGPITFERFMEMALYYPGLGYYTSEREKIGPQGDFYTSPEVHPVFGKVLAGQFYEMWQHLGEPRQWQLVEYGAGRGLLARDVLCFLRERHPRSFEALSYYIIEAGPFFILRQKEMLGGAGIPPGKVKWVDGPARAHGGGGITGAFFSNELVDALPFHRVRLRPDGLKEIYVDYKNGEFVEVECPLSDPDLSRYFEEEGVALDEGQTAEVNLRARRWLGEISENLGRGFVLTIDYGGSAEELYAKSRFNGTMRCFRRHRLVNDPYDAIGAQDITASVNFSSLRRWGEAFGLKTAGLLTQAEFLVNGGLLGLAGGRDDYGYDEEAHRTADAVKKLILPGGMGNVFRVLVQYKGFAAVPPLTGLAKRLDRLLR
ncbi:MAG: SAM-dependent methyltransferase [Peptococcaceae bacterium]|nr:SAM-dependent methyltransferase [Peptococcaceae bacterium]